MASTGDDQPEAVATRDRPQQKRHHFSRLRRHVSTLGGISDDAAPGRAGWTTRMSLHGWPLLLCLVAAVLLVAGGSTAILMAGTASRNVPTPTAAPAATPSPAKSAPPARPQRTSASTARAPKATPAGSATANPPGSVSSTTLPPAQSTPAALVCAGMATDPAPGTTVQIKASLDTVTATITGMTGTEDSGPDVVNAQIVVTDGSATAVDEPLTSSTSDGASSATPAVAFTAIGPAPPGSANGHASAPAGSAGASMDPLCLARFPGSATPVVLIGVASAGANCCTDLRILTPSGQSTSWSWLDDPVGSAPVHVELIGSKPAIVTANSAFAYRFTDFAASGMPILVQQIRDGAIVDVTRQYPSLVSEDAASWWHRYLASPGDPLGVLAAWTADECLLGQQASAFTTLGHINAQGQLADAAVSGSAASSGPGNILHWPQGSAYIAALQSFLVSSGYCSPT